MSETLGGVILGGSEFGVDPEVVGVAAREALTDVDKETGLSVRDTGKRILLNSQSTIGL